MAIEITSRDLLRLGWHKIYSTSLEQYEKEIRDQLQGMLGQYGLIMSQKYALSPSTGFPAVTRTPVLAWMILGGKKGRRPTRLVEPSLGGSPLPIPIQSLAPNGCCF